MNRADIGLLVQCMSRNVCSKVQTQNADLKLAESKSEAACAKGTFVMLNREVQKRFLNGSIREILGILKR